ncbi:unnamed protein product, partial [Heterosigma akashiwo]
GSASGSAYVFTSDSGSWVQAAKVVATDGTTSSYFGRGLADLSNSSFVAGAYGSGAMGFLSGSAYVFTLNSGTWVQANKIAASDGAGSDYFGYGLTGLSSSNLVAGAYSDDDDGSASGSAYVFTFNSGTYVQAQKVVADDGSAGDQFGISVSGIGESSFAVGAQTEDATGLLDAGSAYVFSLGSSNWVQQAKV